MLRIIVACLFMLLPLVATSQPALPVEAFASLPEVRQVTLSPDGKRILFIRNFTSGKRHGTLVSIYDIETQKVTVPLSSDNTKYLVRWVRWANNNQLLIGASFPEVRGGVGVRESRLLTYDLKEQEVRPAYSPIFLRKLDYLPQFQDQVIDFLPGDDKHVLIELASGRLNSTKVIKLNIKSGFAKTYESAKKNVERWTLDRQNRARVALERQDTTYRVLVRKNPKSDKWAEQWTFESFSQDQVWPIGFEEDPNILFYEQYHQGRLAVFKADISQQKLSPELVFSDENYDVDGGLIYSELAKKYVGVRHETDNGFTFWEPSYVGFQEALNKALPEKHNTVVSFSADEQRYILRSSSDIDGGTYFFGDRKSGTLQPIAVVYEALKPGLMAEKKSVTYKARDGLEISAYLTLPKTGKAPYPTVIHPHGGPISYDGKGFDYWTQFFANRGYAVLQMNFRGSSGYGFDFMSAGLQAWGEEMQTDVEDGTRWLIKEGIANADKICVVGASYGGYAALMEAARNSQLYQCAISFAGVSDVKYLVDSYFRFTSYDIAKAQIGSDKKQLKANSPVNFAEDISIPVLLVHGDKDRSVKVQHSRKMYKALKKADKNVTYIEQEGGNHFLSNGEHRLALFTAMDNFLGKYLGKSKATR